MKPRGSLARYRSAAAEHLTWCDQVGIRMLGGRWDLEDALTGLLLAAVVGPQSAPATLGALCRENWNSVEITAVWWPSVYVDMIVNFRVAGEPHMLALEHKHLNSPSNAPGYRHVGGGVFWQTESLLREVDRVRRDGEGKLLGGPFDESARAHFVVLDARGRTMYEAFELTDADEPHKHEVWDVVSYTDLARSLRLSYETNKQAALEPLLGQLFASERQ